jgi:K+-transporting ATPase ATPase B chain
MREEKTERPLFEPSIVRRALLDSFVKLNPRYQIRKPVMFVVEIGSVLTTALFLYSLFASGEDSPAFTLAISLWLWFTVLFANFAESMAEGRGKAQADTLRSSRKDVTAKRLSRPERNAEIIPIPSSQLSKGDIVLVEAGDTVPGDGEVIAGVASVNESAITGESAPVIRESGGDRSAVTGGTLVLSDWLVMRITANPGEAFLDRMISMVEGSSCWLQSLFSPFPCTA